MIEKIARASFTCWRKRMDELGYHLDKGKTFEDMSDSEREFAFMNAKAVIEAIREFTDEMFDASDSQLVRGELEQNWQNVIDAALKEKS